MNLRILFIGGNGTISGASSELAVQRGYDLTLLNRGRSSRRAPIAGTRHLTGDAEDAASIAAAIGDETFDVVANFRSFSSEQVERDIALFEGRTRQYVYISSASAYQKPIGHLPITESTPLRNPFWQYSRDKIAGEELLVAAYRERGFPMTIVRPSHTYDRERVPLLGGWTAVDRMRRGKPVVVHGDGTSLWTVTHTRDFAVAFVGLLGNDRAVGEVFQITSDEVLTWNQIAETIATAAGAEFRPAHIASDAIARELPDLGPGLLGDKAHSVIFDNSKVKSLVPEFRPAIPYWRGAREMIAWHDADPSRRVVDTALDADFDRLVERYA
ncbi:NAD-dependent epimerase/dehydratase family protein [Agromyces sp. SYSU K20354]|uniref:NAD-dependent epimerase/dehydratase family protein n=1 Tax=Agromyces cavernae TaxID=2898659 RepID=UPI001E314AC3|nr:NAD-dependent epimerase/dehydratase family protein [Agromyces cavernae]MCD2443721.1 NAD-dependent epimerase/dehydratase family protein [Agromyces cavernae]